MAFRLILMIHAAALHHETDVQQGGIAQGRCGGVYDSIHALIKLGGVEDAVAHGGIDEELLDEADDQNGAEDVVDRPCWQPAIHIEYILDEGHADSLGQKRPEHEHSQDELLGLRFADVLGVEESQPQKRWHKGQHKSNPGQNSSFQMRVGQAYDQRD